MATAGADLDLRISGTGAASAPDRHSRRCIAARRAGIQLGGDVVIGRERAQALVEAVVAMPVCLACAVTIVDCGVLVRDRIATTQAATRAAEAQLHGEDPLAAARGAMPAPLRSATKVRLDGDHLEVRVASRGALARLAGHPISHRSRVELAATEVAR
jgi:hypothetical protein